MKIEDLHYSLLNVPVDEENFDLEKWRRENPMDYLKALYLVLSSGDWVPGIQIILQWRFLLKQSTN